MSALELLVGQELERVERVHDYHQLTFSRCLLNVFNPMRVDHGPTPPSVHCQDREAECGWSAIRFKMLDVDELRFELGRFTFEVLSFGIQFVWREHLVYLVLAPAADESPDLPDLSRNIGYVSGLSCEYELIPM